MKLSTRRRYAVMAMADLATYQNGKPVSLVDISLRQNISLSYLEQLFSKLKHEKRFIIGYFGKTSKHCTKILLVNLFTSLCLFDVK